ncbi:MAG: DUF6754 domain-containing protein [Fimbriimonadales bacterium]
MDTPWAHRIFALIVCAVILLRTARARKGREYHIRRIPGVDAMEESIGRATEIGRPILFLPGILGLEMMPTIAGLSVLRWVAKRAVEMLVRLIVVIFEPSTTSVVTEILRDTYRQADQAERFDEKDIVYGSNKEDAYASAIMGVIQRERVAAGFYFGGFGFESLLVSENGFRVGAIQVAATTDVAQIPFFICACDYVLIGEELYAASAYLTRDPVQVGSLSGQDFGKALVAVLILMGSVVALWMSLSSNGPTLNPIEGILLK